MTQLAKSAIVLALIAMVLPTAVREFATMFAHSSRQGAQPGGVLESVFTVLFWVMFSIGLVVRMLDRFTAAPDTTTERERQQQERRLRTTVRRPAQNVPIDEDVAEPEDDNDPELPWDDEE